MATQNALNNITKSLSITSAVGVDYNPGSDVDTDIITVGVTGTPTISWDESSDAFRSTKPWVLSSDGNGDVTHTVNGTTIVSEIELHSSGNTDLGGLTIHRHTDTNNFGGHIFTLRSNGSHASPTIVTSGDTIGRIIGAGYDGTDYATAAEVRFVVDGTPGANDMPGRIVFLTSPDGSQTLTEAARVNSSQQLQLSVGLIPDANDGAYLGISGTAFSDLFLASGAVIDFAAGNAVITHSSGILTVSTGDLRVTTAGTNTASVVTVGGTQTLTGKTFTSPTVTTSTLSGHQTMEENAALLYDPVLSADGKYNGIVRGGTAGTALAFGDLIYLDPTDSRWELVDANSASGADGDPRGIIGMCVLAAAGDGSATTVLLNGIIRADAVFPAMTVNAPMYVSETAGDITGTQPTTSGVVIRVVGFALTSDELYFNPSPDYITHA